MNNARSLYLTDTVQTASPAHLLVMLYDRLVLDIERAEVALIAGDAAASTEHLVHAQDIVTELMSSLDVTVWDGGPGLMAIYTFLYSQLVEANTFADAQKATACKEIVVPLRDAWQQAAQTASASSSVVGGVGGELGVG